MFHSIKLYPQSTEDPLVFVNEGVDTWNKFHIVPEKRPSVDPPELKSNEVDVPGSDGILDLSEAPQGYPTYKNRTGSWDFIVMNDFCQPVEKRDEWFTVYSNVMNYLHGRVFRIILEDDYTYFYEGRLEVESFESENYLSKIKIKYNLKPYKWSIYRSTDDWMWDPFNFDTGIVPTDYGKRDDPWNIQCWDNNEDGEYTGLHFRTIQINREDIGRAPITPTFYFKHEYTESVIANSAKATRGLYFKLPGWSTNRLYKYNPETTWEKGFKIPEYVFRSEMTDSQLTIKCATALSKTICALNAYTTEQKTCSYCNQLGLIPGLSEGKYDDAYFTLKCRFCDRWNSTHFRYAKEKNSMFFEFRQGGF